MIEQGSESESGGSRQSKHTAIVSNLKGLMASIERLEGLRDAINGSLIPPHGEGPPDAPGISLGSFLTETPSLIIGLTERIDTAVNCIRKEIF